MKKVRLLFIILISFVFGMADEVKALEPSCTSEAAMELAKIVYNEVGRDPNDYLSLDDAFYAELVTASIVLNNANINDGENWYEKIWNINSRHNSYPCYGGDERFNNKCRKNKNYRERAYTDFVSSQRQAELLYVAELVLSGKFNVPRNMHLQASKEIVEKNGSIWDHIDVKVGYNEYFGYTAYAPDGAELATVDVFGRNITNTSSDYYRKLAASFRNAVNYSKYNTSNVCSVGGVNPSPSPSPSYNGNSGSNKQYTADVPSCENPNILRVIFFGKILLNIVRIAVPIGMIAFGMFDFSKAVKTSDEEVQKKSIKLFGKRVLMGVLVFLVPLIVEKVILALGTLTDAVNFSDCLKNANETRIQELQANYDKLIENGGNSEAGNNSGNSDNSGDDGSAVDDSYDKIIFVGDSRTYQICCYVEKPSDYDKCSFTKSGEKPFTSENKFYISQISMAYSWFDETAVPAVNKIINSDKSKYAIVSLMGVNRPDEIDKYVARYVELANSTWKNQRIILVSVMPVDESKMKEKGYDTNVTNNAKIEEFNNKLQEISVANIKYCDIYSAMNSNMGKYELGGDGLHYTVAGNQEIYKLIQDKCL